MEQARIDGSEIKWFQAPKNFDLTIPEEPQEIIQKYNLKNYILLNDK